MQNTLFQIDELPTLAEDDTPQYKAITFGFSHLSTSELIALTIQGTGEKALNAVRSLLSKANNNLRELGKLSIHELTKVDGIGKSKALAIAAAIELGIRREMAQALQAPIITSSADTFQFFKARFADLRHEVFSVMFLNRANKIMHFEVISEGGITGTVADPRIILRKALEVGAVNIILCHNHPSGSLRPSHADEAITEKIKQACSYLDIKLLDHIIVSDSGYYSFTDEGLL